MSQFIEMFGNPFEINSEVVPLSSLCSINPSKPKGLDDSLSVSFIPMDRISEDGEYAEFETKPLKDVKKGFTYCAEDDVLFAKITPCMENGKGAILKGLSNGIGFGSTEFHVLRPILGISNSEWLYFLTKLNGFRIDAAKNMTGTGGQKRVPSSYLLNFKVLKPQLEVQREFAKIVHQADKSKFGDFKSQFIEIFYGMETTPVKDYIDDSFPGEWGTEDKDGNGVKVIRTTNFTNSGKLNLADVVTRSIEDRKVVRKQIKKYDTILERSGGTADNPVGRVVLFEEDNLFLCNNFTQVLRFKDVDPRFAFYALYYFYQTNRTAIRSMGSKTTGIQNLNMSKYLEIGIPNASDEDQKAFVTIAEQADKSKSVIQKALVYLNDIQSDELGKIA